MEFSSVFGITLAAFVSQFVQQCTFFFGFLGILRENISVYPTSKWPCRSLIHVGLARLALGMPGVYLQLMDLILEDGKIVSLGEQISVAY